MKSVRSAWPRVCSWGGGFLAAEGVGSASDPSSPGRPPKGSLFGSGLQPPLTLMVPPRRLPGRLNSAVHATQGREVPVMKSRESRVLARLLLARAVLSCSAAGDGSREASSQCCSKEATASPRTVDRTLGGAMYLPQSLSLGLLLLSS